MAYAREIFIAIKQKIRFQQADKEADSHYTVLGNTLVCISNHCTWMKIWDNYLQKNPQDAKRNILSLVFEDGEDTYTEECLFTVTERKKPIRVTEYVFKSASLSKQDVKMIIGSLQQMMTTNKFNEPTGKGERFDRISVNPDYMNIETTADRRAIPAERAHYRLTPTLLGNEITATLVIVKMIGKGDKGVEMFKCKSHSSRYFYLLIP